MDAKKVFISYKSEEFDDALRVKNTLEENGISCWMAPMCISGGASYASEIPAAIKDCEAFVLILSEKVQQSKWVPRELDQAINLNKRVMPFTIESCNINDEFGFYLSNVQRYDAFIDYDEAMKKLLSELKAFLGVPESVTEPAEPSQPEKKVQKTTKPPSEKEATHAEKKTKTAEKKAPKDSKTAEKKPVKKEKKNANTGKKKSKVGVVLAVMLAVVAVVAALSVIITQSRKVVIADTTFKKTDSVVTLEEKELDAEDMLSFAKFERLYRITLKNCVIKTDDISVFSTYDISELELSDCQLTQAQLDSLDFEAMNRLYNLNLNGNTALTDLSCIVPAADTLNKLYINKVSVSTPDFLKDFVNLTDLSIDGIGVSDLSPLYELAYLKYFSANDNKLENLAGLENTSVLQEVSLSGNALTDISTLCHSVETLKKVNLDFNNLTSLDALSECIQMTNLSANNNQIGSVYSLSKMENLTYLSLANNGISVLSGFPKCPALTYLDLSGNDLWVVSGLVFSTENYVTVNLSNNDLTSVKLPENSTYKALLLHGNGSMNINDLTVNTSGITVSFDYFEALDLSLLKAWDFNSIYVVDCPTNRKIKVEEASSSVTLVTAEEADSILGQ